MRPLDSNTAESGRTGAAPDDSAIESAVQHLQLARSFTDAVRLERKLFAEADQFDAWQSTTADLYFTLLHVCSARLALELRCDAAPQELMQWLNNIDGGRLVNQFVSPDVPQDLRNLHPISKAVITGTLLRQIKLASETLKAHAHPSVRDEAMLLQLAVQSIGLVFADLGGSLLIAEGLADRLGLGPGPQR